MSRKPLLSIIVPAFNVYAYLSQCIESIQLQGFTDFEIILIDDGSTDGTSDLCDTLHGRYQNMRILHQKNQGLSAARNRGIELARGRYCLFSDADDFICKDSLAVLAKYIRAAREPDIIVTRRMTYDSVSGTLRECRYVFQEEKMSACTSAQKYRELWNMPDCWLEACIFCVKREYLKKGRLSFYEGILHEDEEWVPRIFFNTDRIGFLNTPVYCNRIGRPGSITATPNIKRMFDKLLITDLLKKEFSKSRYTGEVRKAMRLRIQMIYVGVLSELFLYKKETDFLKLVHMAEDKRVLLKSSERKRYVLIYYAAGILGAEAVSRMLLKLR